MGINNLDRAHTIVGIIIIIGVLIGLLYFIQIYVDRTTNPEGGTGATNTSTPSVRVTDYITVDEYNQLLNDTISILAVRIRILEPWIISKCPNCTNISGTPDPEKIMTEIARTEYKLRITSSRLIGSCKSTLWEEYVRYVVNEWLRSYSYLDKAEMYLNGDGVRRDIKIAYIYLNYAKYTIQLLNMLSNASIRQQMCQISIAEFKNYTWNIYHDLRQILYDKKNRIIGELDSSIIKSSKYPSVLETIINKINRELGSDDHIYADEQVFQKILERNPMHALEEAINTFVIVSGYEKLIENITIFENFEKITVDKEFVETYFNNMKEEIWKLYNTTDKDILKQLVAHIIARKTIRTCDMVRELINEKINTKVMYSKIIYYLFIEDPNNMLNFIDLFYAAYPIDEFILCLGK